MSAGGFRAAPADEVVTVVDVLVAVIAMQVLTEGNNGTGTDSICGFTIGPQTSLVLLNSCNQS